MSVYKKFLPKDYAVVPFNAHKQYTFDSGSAAFNSIDYFTSSHSPNNISLYSNDNLKYQQIDHLYYRNYITDISNKFEDESYLKHKRTLYKEANILSIPSGLYGYEIKPGSFFLSSSYQKVIDDKYGNLIISGTNYENDFITDPRSILLNIGPVNGFKKYDLNIYDGYIKPTRQYKKGDSRVNPINSYSTPFNKYEYDDSYFLNKIYYKNVNFSEKILHPSYNSQSRFPGIDFNGTDSEVKIYHDDSYNFNSDDDFSIEFWVNIPSMSNEGDQMYIVEKSCNKNSFPQSSVSSLPQTVNSTAGNQYPFSVYLEKPDVSNTKTILVFEKSNGSEKSITAVSLNYNESHHIICRHSASKMCIFTDGIKNPDVTTPTGLYQNDADIYIGNKGGDNYYFSGSLSQVKIYNKILTNQQCFSHYEYGNGSPYIGNIFYSQGLITITHPQYQHVLNAAGYGIGTMTIDDSGPNDPPEISGIFTVGGVVGTSTSANAIFGIQQLKFQGSHLIYENEYKCTIDEYEYNDTLNPSARKLKSFKSPDLANFASGSLFKPYITTIGLYNKNNELLVVGKLGQPIRTSNETDTTIVLRWDT